MSDKPENNSNGETLHYIWDFHGISPDLLQNASLVKSTLVEALDRGDFSRVNEPVIHQFQEGGEGITALVILQESHASLHTYPERNYMALELYMCGTGNPRIVQSMFKREFSPKQSSETIIPRG